MNSRLALKDNISGVNPCLTRSWHRGFRCAAADNSSESSSGSLPVTAATWTIWRGGDLAGPGGVLASRGGFATRIAVVAVGHEAIGHGVEVHAAQRSDGVLGGGAPFPSIASVHGSGLEPLGQLFDLQRIRLVQAPLSPDLADPFPIAVVRAASAVSDGHLSGCDRLKWPHFGAQWGPDGVVISIRVSD